MKSTSGRIAHSGRREWIVHWERDPVPGTLDWDIWIGPAPMRLYKAGHKPYDQYGFYTPFSWRGWQDLAPARSATWRATRSTCRFAL